MFFNFLGSRVIRFMKNPADKMIFEIKHRLSGNILFSLETESLKLCVEAAVKSETNLDGAYLGGENLGGANLGGANLDGANLDGANLGGANLDGAYLGGAYLDSANLRGANLDGANLGGAYLRGANLDGAYLGGANLDSANLGGANLDGAYLGGANLDGANLGGAKLIGERPIVQISPIGSRADFLSAYITDKGVFLKTGCFFGKIDKFRESRQKTHGDNAHAKEYIAALSLIETHAEIYTPKAEGK